MDSMMKVKEVNIEIILKEKIQYAETNINSGEYEDDMYVIQGEITAYRKILEDIRDYSVNDFARKYIDIVKKIHYNIENNVNLDEKKTAWMSGYNNATVDILKLINPSYEFDVWFKNNSQIKVEKNVSRDGGADIFMFGFLKGRFRHPVKWRRHYSHI